MSRFIPVILIVLSLLLVSYYDYEPEPETTSYTPVLMTRQQLKTAVRTDGPRTLVNPGKIYLKDQYFFIVEKFEGIHVIDNSNRSAPRKVGFIHIPGCVDLALKGNYLYADNAVDLVTIDIGGFPNIRVTSRQENVFPELVPPDLGYIPFQYSKENRPGDAIVVAWVEKK